MISSLLLPRSDFVQEKTADNAPKRQEEKKRSHGLPSECLFRQQGISPSGWEELPYRCHCLRQQLCGKQDAREEDGGEKEKNGNHRGFRRVFHSQSYNAGNAQRHHQEERQFREIVSRVCGESSIKQYKRVTLISLLVLIFNGGRVIYGRGTLVCCSYLLRI